MNDMMAETALLGAVLSGFPRMDELKSIIYPGDFLNPQHERIFLAACQVAEQGEVVDALVVKVAMGADVNGLPGGPAYLVQLAQSAPHVMSAPSYAREVKALAIRRRVIATSTQLQQMAESGMPIEEMADRARASVDAAVSQAHSHAGSRIGDSLPEVLEIAQNGRARSLPTGWSEVDKLIGGFAPGRFIVIGARPGVGKSIVGTNMALQMADTHRHAVFMASMEMGREEVTQRILSAHASVNLTGLDRGRTTDDAWERIAAKANDILEMPITIDDSPMQTLTSIRQGVRDLKRQRDDVALVVVDYLQLMQARDRKVNRVEQIGEISRGLKIVSREFNTCVVAMAQVNRESAQRAGGRPVMSDLRESGSIEADADAVILLHRPMEDEDGVEFIIEKNRSGARGETRLKFEGYFARISSPTWTPTSAIERGSIEYTATI